MNARKLAFDMLVKLEKNQQFSNILLDKTLLSSALSDQDKALASAIFYGVTERRISLDYEIRALSNIPLEKIELPALTALRIGIYQLKYLDKIPAHAAINESVGLCPRRMTGFVNAVLRSYLRNGNAALPSREKEPIKYLSVRFSVNEALVSRITSDYGIERTGSILEGFEKEAHTTIAVNTLKTTRDELMAHINGATPTAYAKSGLRVKGSVRELYGYEDGLFFVQDEASQLCVEAIDAKRGETVIDVCACPGSKSFGCAISMNDDGKVLSFDLHENKLSLVDSGAKRLSINIITTAQRDGRDLLPELVESADRVICDVPCSGFGVLSKKPELRYKDPKDSEALPNIQLSILENASRYVKSGGYLIYSTCTILKSENEDNIKRFLEAHKDFVTEPFSLGKIDFKNGYSTLLPDTYGTDGFFIARMKKI